MKHTVEVMIPEAEIKARIAELPSNHRTLARQRQRKVGWSVVWLLHVHAQTCAVQVSLVDDASSYGSGMSTTRDVKILKDLDEDIRKDVLIVEHHRLR